MRNAVSLRLRLPFLAAAAAGVLAAAAAPANAQPTGASVAIGSANVNRADAATTIVTQSSQKALINWQDFSVPAGANVVFRQPDASAITLNRVLGTGASAIDGNLLANGQVWLINPNGILFGPGSRIDVGALLATTSDIRDDDFLAGAYDFGIASGAANPAIVNLGSIRTGSGGAVVLAAPSVANQGLIEADLGNVVLAGANTFTVDFSGDNLLRFAITAPASQAAPDGGGGPPSALVSNAGTIAAPGGKVMLTARAAREVLDGVINTTGMIEATSVSVQNGVIVLDAGPGGTARVGGTLDVSGTKAGETGGSISVLGGAAEIADGARLDASGDSGGGTVLVGGNFHGAGPEPSADTVSVGNAVITADAIDRGDGGKVALWSNASTSFAGQISAKGGAMGGNGGFVETSGGSLSVAPSAQVFASAPNGAPGTWLLDPKFIIVATTGGVAYSAQTYAPGSSTYTVTPASIATALAANTNVLLEANTDLTVTNAISAPSTASGTTLSFHAGRSIMLDADVDIGGGTANLIANDPIAVSDRDPGAGSIVTTGGAKITASVLNLTLSNGNTAGAIGSVGTPVLIKASSGLSVKTFGADAFLKSPNTGVIVGTAAGGIDVGSGEIVLSATGQMFVGANVTAGHALFAASGNFTILAGKTITGSGSGDAIVIGIGNALTNLAGAGALNTTGGGRWLIFAQDPTGTASSSLAGSPYYDRNFDFTDNSYDTVQGAGNRFAYAVAPSLTVTANDTSRPYGAANPSFTATITGLQGSDTLAGAVAGAPSLTTTATASAPTPGNTAPITAALGTLSSDYNYGFTFVDGTLTITSGVLTAGLTGSVTKVYDGTTAASLVAGNYTLSGLVPGDVVTLNNPAAGTYNTKDVGTGKTVSVTGLTISGADSGKYTLSSTSTAGAVGVVNRATLTAALTGSVSKVYNGNTAAALAAGNYSLTGVLTGEVVTLNNPAAGTYDSKNVGTGKTVSVTGLAISGADSGNYMLASTSIFGAVGEITKASATPGLTGTVSKVYDGNTVATLASGNYTLSGIVSGDSVSLNNPAGSYDTENVGTGKTVSVSGLVLSGGDSGNYMLSSTSASGPVGTITQGTVTAALTGTVSKPYDGTTAAILAAGNYTLSGVASGDSVALNNPASGTYDNENVGSGKTVNVTGLLISGPDAVNYTLASASISGAVGTISRATLTAGLTGSVSKVYNGNTAATLAPGNYTLSGVFSGDSVSLNNPVSGTYDTKNVGTGKTVNVTGLVISGTDSGNYTLASASVSDAVGTITRATLTAGLTGTVSKVYDSTTAATLAAGNYTLSGVITGDSVALNNPASGTYDNENAGTGKTVNVGGLALSGGDADNYALASAAISGAVGTITRASLTAGLTGSVNKVYDRTTAATLTPANYTLPGVYSGDSVSLNNPASGSYDNKNVGTAKTVTVNGLAISGGDAGNYALTSASASGSIGTVTKAPLGAELTGTVSKVYDGTTTASLAPGNYKLTGVFSGDAVALNNPSSAAYDNKNVGTGKTVSVSGLAVSGADAGNYTFTDTSLSAAIGTITSRPLTASLTGSVSKAYDGTATAALSPSNYALTGVIGGDAVVLGMPASGSYNNKAVGNAKPVSATDLTISGAGASNYTLSSTVASGAIGVITAKTVTATLTGTVSKLYDGTTTASPAASNFALAGVLAGDTVAVSTGAANYSSKEVGSNKLVSVSGLALSGADAGNYALAASSASAAIGVIAKAALTAGLTGTVTKVFDGNVAAIMAASNYTLSGVFAGDIVALNNPVNGTYDTPVVDTGKIVTVTGLVLTGANAGDYVLSSTTASGAVGVITKPVVTSAVLTVFLPTVAPPVTVIAPPDAVGGPPPVVIALDTGPPPAPLAFGGDGGNGGNGGEGTTSSDGVTQSVGQSLDGSRRAAATPNTVLLGGMLNALVPTLPTGTPRGVPPADQDFSSWGNGALWQQ